MIRLFRRQKATIDTISIPDLGWTVDKQDKTIKQWVNPDRIAVLSLNFFDKAPDIPSSKDIDILRDFYRKAILGQNGGLVYVAFVELEGQKAIKTLFKFPQPERGMSYLASLTVPFRSCSYVIKLQVPETGIMGTREAIVSEQLLRENKISSTKEDSNWSKDPYDDTYRKGTLMNVAESPLYDLEFHDHPLSLARLWLGQVEKGVVFDKKISQLTPFPK